MPKYFGFYFLFEDGEFLPSQRAELTARCRCQRASRCFPSKECPTRLSIRSAYVEVLSLRALPSLNFAKILMAY